MANSNQPQESMVLMPFPLRGLELTTEFSQQPPLTTSVANNVRGYEPTTGRDRGGQRSGLSRYLPQLVTAGKIQHLNFIVDPQADALIADIDNYGPLYLDYMDDPSTNNNARHLGHRNNGRRFRRGGSGRQPNRNRPSLQRTHPTITWNNPADITAGTPLGGSQLNAVATDGILAVAGSFVYSPPSGTILAVGNGQSLSTTFTPTDTGFYFSETKSVTINVIKETPVLTWANPADITLGTPLSSTQLNATATHPVTMASIVGTFTYTPPAGTFLAVGAGQVLSVHFVPTDTLAYNTPVDKTVSITVTDESQPDIPDLVASLDGPEGVEFAAGTYPILEVPGPPSNSQADLDFADEQVGLPTEVFVLGDIGVNDHQFVGIRWNWATMHWEAS